MRNIWVCFSSKMLLTQPIAIPYICLNFKNTSKKNRNMMLSKTHFI